MTARATPMPCASPTAAMPPMSTPTIPMVSTPTIPVMAAEMRVAERQEQARAIAERIVIISGEEVRIAIGIRIVVSVIGVADEGVNARPVVGGVVIAGVTETQIVIVVGNRLLGIGQLVIAMIVRGGGVGVV